MRREQLSDAVAAHLRAQITSGSLAARLIRLDETATQTTIAKQLAATAAERITDAEIAKF